MEQREASTSVVVREDLASHPLAVTPDYINSTRTSLILLRQLVREVLVRDRDYGKVPGISGEFLWDPGASQIIASFNCHVGPRRFLNFVNDGQKISIVIEVALIHTPSGAEVGSGIGAASSQETKHKYRWVDNPREWGFGEEAVHSLKTKEQYGRTVYRIPNPEHDELLNTITKIASKRAEVDAAEGLPGASSALRELFSVKDAGGKDKNPPGRDPRDSNQRWTSFWSQVKALGLNAEQVHEKLQIKSMKEWTEKGKSLDDAIKILSAKLGSQPKQRIDWDAVAKEQVPDYARLEAVVKNLCGLEPTQIYREMGGSSRADMTVSAWHAFLQIKENYAPAS